MCPAFSDFLPVGSVEPLWERLHRGAQQALHSGLLVHRPPEAASGEWKLSAAFGLLCSQCVRQALLEGAAWALHPHKSWGTWVSSTPRRGQRKVPTPAWGWVQVCPQVGRQAVQKCPWPHTASGAGWTLGFVTPSAVLQVRMLWAREVRPPPNHTPLALQ